tara:strand:- start:121 stop:1050 length:930 start_codon:yes stop_codon:yes gene_type:complete
MKIECKECDHRSFSSGCDFQRCPRRYFWKKHAGLRGVSETRDLAMTFGSAVHAGAPYTHTGELQKGLDAFQDTWGDGDEWGDKKRNSRVGRNILLDLMSFHRGASYPFEVLPPETKAFVRKEHQGPHEVAFSLDFGLPSGKPVDGRIDALGRRKEGGHGVVPVEYKTASQIWKTFGDIFVVSMQVVTYGMALQLVGMEVEEGFVEGILVASGKTEVLPVPVDLSAEQMGRGVEWWLGLDQELLRAERQEGAEGDPLVWRADWGSCTPYPYFGLQGFLCEYQPLCLAGDRWEELVGMYQQEGEEVEGGDG